MSRRTRSMRLLAARWRATLGRPVIVLALTGLLHLAGAREATVALSGTAAVGMGTLVGLVYVMLWLFCVVVVPPWLAGALAAPFMPRWPGRPGRSLSRNLNNGGDHNEASPGSRP